MNDETVHLPVMNGLSSSRFLILLCLSLVTIQIGGGVQSLGSVWSGTSARTTLTDGATPFLELTLALFITCYTILFPNWMKSTDKNKSTYCDAYHNQSIDVQCQFVKDTEDCQIDEGFVNYLKFTVCHFEARLAALPLSILALWLIFLLVALGVTADNFFCPALTVISHTLKLSQNIAGVTFLAFGNGAPDIFSAVAAISAAKNGDAGLAIGALFGAGIFVTTIVAGAIAFTHPFKMVERPFLRDVIFYLAAVFWTFNILYVGQITFWEALDSGSCLRLVPGTLAMYVGVPFIVTTLSSCFLLYGFIGLYVLYVAVVVIGRKVYQRQRQRASDVDVTSDTPTINGTMANPALSINNDDVTDGGHAINASLAKGLGATESLFAGVLLHGNDPIQRDTEALLGRHVNDDTEDGPHILVEFFQGINPINTGDWKELGIISKIYEFFKAPIVFLLIVTVPVVDYSEKKHNWNRLLNCFHCISAPVFCIMMTKVGTDEIADNLQVWELVLPTGVVLALIVFLTSKSHKQPIYHPLFAYGGFLVAVIWIYSIANEIVNLLEMYGIVLEVSNEVLGLTVLAWGNSIGDMIADVTMAKQGFPKMALSACFGGPLFNMLLGIGISCVIATQKNGGTFMLKHRDVQYILAAGLAFSLVFSMVFMLVRRFCVGRFYSLLLFIIYVIFLAIALLTDLHIINLS